MAETYEWMICVKSDGIYPVGYIHQWNTAYYNPDFWTICNGDEYSPNLLPELKKVLMDIYGLNKLPNLRNHPLTY